VSSPTLLIQQIPDIETSGAMLLRQVIVRDTGAESKIASEPAEGAVALAAAPSGVDDLRWLHGARAIAAKYISGPMRGAVGEVLSTEYVGDRLLKRIQALDSAAR
jgi:hypothetical protein